MRIFELFQTNYDYTRLDDKHYRFKTQKGNEYIVRFENLYFPIDWQLEPALHVAFALVKDGELSDKIEQVGDVFAVFSTVSAIIKDHIASSDINYIIFGADLSQPSRVKLYEQFIKYLPKFISGWKFIGINENFTPGIRNYILKKNNS